MPGQVAGKHHIGLLQYHNRYGMPKQYNGFLYGSYRPETLQDTYEQAAHPVNKSPVNNAFIGFSQMSVSRYLR